MWYGVDWNGPLPYTLEDNCVEVPETLCPLDEVGMSELLQSIPPSTHSDYWGIDVYLNTLSFVQQKLCISTANI